MSRPFDDAALRPILDIAGDGGWDWNISTGEVYFSDSWLRWLGYQRGDIEPRLQGLESIVHPDDRPRMMAALIAHFEGRAATYQCELRLRRKSGRYCYVLTRGKIVARSTHQKPQRFVATDLEVREGTADAAGDTPADRESEGSANGWLWETDAELRLDFVPPQFDAIGISTQSLLGKTRWEVAGVDPETDPMWGRHRDELLAHRPFRDFRFSLTGPDGAVHHFSDTGWPVFESDGGFVGYRGLIYDRTSEVRSEERLGVSQRRVMDVFERLPDAIAIFDRNDDLIVFNGHYRRLMGPYGVDLLTLGTKFDDVAREMVRRGFLKLSPDQRENAIRSLMDDHRRAPASRQHQVAGGQWIQIAQDATSEGGTMVLLRDVTDLRMSADRQRGNERLEVAGQLTAGVAHKFNNLLQVVQGNVELLEETYEGDEDLASLIDQTKQATKRGSELIKDLLIFGLKAPLQVETVNLNAVVTDLSQSLTDLVGDQIRFSTVLTRELWPTLADREVLERCVVELIRNAAEALNGEGRVSIQTANLTVPTGELRGSLYLPAGEYVVLRVTDTGSGIAADKLASIMAPFFTTKDKSLHNGMGLSVVYGLATYCGGYVDVDSTVDVGTTVQVFLPRAPTGS